MYLYLTLFILFAFGLVVGSFLNVLIYRLEGKKRKTLGGRSFCPNCEAQIKWYDNIPVVSWLALGGKCRNCKKKISIQYPLVELGTGILFSLVGWFFLFPNSGFFAPLIMTNDTSIHYDYSIGAIITQSLANISGLTFWIFFASCLIVIFAYDLKHQIIPDEIIYTSLAVGLLYVGVNALLGGSTEYLVDHLLSGLLAGGFFYTLAAVSNGKWMGGGDIKLAAFMGLVLGWQGVVVALYAAFILGAIVGAFTLIAGKKKLGSKIPFGPFLVAGTFIGLFLGEKIISFYGRMFL